MSERPVNVGEIERLAAAGLAGVLFAQCLRRPSFFKLAGLGCLIYRALSGHCFGYEWLGLSTCPLPKVQPKQ